MKHMLVLGRKDGQAIRIGDNIHIIIKLPPGCTEARCLIKAPREIAVNRAEIYRRIQKEKLNGVKSTKCRQKEMEVKNGI